MKHTDCINSQLIKEFSLKFSIGEPLTVEEFDHFLLSRNIITNPKNINNYEAAQTFLVAERNQARDAINRLSTGKKVFHDQKQRFKISVLDHGKTYMVETVNEVYENGLISLPKKAGTYFSNKLKGLDDLYESIDVNKMDEFTKLKIEALYDDASELGADIDYTVNKFTKRVDNLQRRIQERLLQENIPRIEK